MPEYVIPAQAGIHAYRDECPWNPACAQMTRRARGALQSL
jgi:hypothetical protein